MLKPGTKQYRRDICEFLCYLLLLQPRTTKGGFPMRKQRLCALLLSLALLLPFAGGLAEGTPAQTLTVSFGVTADALYQDQIAEFERLHPGLTVQVVTNNDTNTHQTYVDSLSSGSSEIDIYWGWSGGTDLDALIGKGLAAPINDAEIARRVAAMYPQFADYVTRSDTIYALPIESWRYWSAVNPTLARKFGLNDRPDSLEGYLNNAMAWYTSYDYPQHAQHYSFNGGKDFEAVRQQIFTIMLRSYTHAWCTGRMGEGAYTFDTPEFRALANWLKDFSALKSREIPADSTHAIYGIDHAVYLTDPSEYYMASETQQVIFRDIGDPYSLRYGEELLPDPGMAGAEPAVHGRIVFMLLNPNSKQQELAIEFLRYLAELPVAEYGLLLYPDGTDDCYPAAAAEAYHASASALCGAACERYNRIFLWDMFPYEIICSYLDDSITLDDALSFMDENLSKSLARLQ